jgi:probable DNA metabolism protein
MTRFIYDGSFDGFLCAAAGAMSAQGDGSPEAGIAPAGCAQGELFCTDIPVVTDARISGALLRRFAAVAGREEADSLVIAQASADPDAPGLILKYIRRTLERGPVVDDISRPEVLEVRRIRDRVMLEIHKLMGFVRFRKTGNRLYYASLEPDSNIVGFIGPHFSDRFRDQAFIIHDVKRGIAFWHDARPGGGSSGIAEIPPLPPELSAAAAADQDAVQAMWREYFTRIAVPQRRNPALQAKNMPRRYWKYLTEVQDRMKGK